MFTASDNQPAFEPPRLSRIAAEFVDEVLVAVQKFNRRWQADRQTGIEAFLPSRSDPRRFPVLVELIKSDLKRKLLSLQPVRLESYLSQWPELADASVKQVDLLECECVNRAAYDVPPKFDELNSRFPSLAKHINLSAIAAQAENVRNRESFLGTGRFFLIRRLGKGGFGVVYEALDRERCARVALKLLPGAMPERLMYFKREFRALADIVHPSLVSLYELFSVSDQWFFTMEYVGGVDFLSYVRQEETQSDVPDTEVACSTAIELNSTDLWKQPTAKVDFNRLRGSLYQLTEAISALHAAHKIHRDIKPSNVLVKPDGSVMLLDFGLVMDQQRAVGDNSSDSGSTVTWVPNPIEECDQVGTAAYMSPEQARGEQLTIASDYYSLGVMLFEALVGERPFQGSKIEIFEAKQTAEAPLKLLFTAGVPEDLIALCRDLLKPDPAARPICEAVLERLQGGANRRRLSELVPLASWTIPFVGRNQHLVELRHAYQLMNLGKSVTVHVIGRSGMGKTRLLHQLLCELVGDHHAVVLSSRCHERESVPYKALDGLVDALAHHLATMHPTESRDLIPADIEALVKVFPVLGTVEAVLHSSTSSNVPPEHTRLKLAATSALRELLCRLGKRRPLVLAIDDMQWADEDSAAILTEILQPPNPPRLLLLASYREESNERPWQIRLHAARQEDLACIDKTLAVGPLDETESRELAAMLIGETAPEAVDRIVRESQGVAYFVHELAMHRKYDDIASLRELSDASHLDEILWARVRQLPDGPRRLLEVVAVAGQPVEMRAAFDAAGLQTSHQQCVAELRAGHLVRTSGPQLDADIETYHDRIREGVLAFLSADTQRGYHEQLAQALDGFGSPQHEATATHYFASGHFERAAQLFETAADEAAETLAFDRAARLFRKALEQGARAEAETAELYVKLAVALANAGRGAESATAYLTAAHTTAPDKSLELRREAAYQFCISGRIEKGRETFAAILAAVGMKLPATPRGALVSLAKERLLLTLRGLKHRDRHASTISPRELAKLDSSWAAAVGFTMMDTIHGADFQSRNLRLALRAGEPYRLARALCWQAAHVSTLGVKSRRATERLLKIARPIAGRIEHPHAEGLLMLAEGIANFFQGRWKNGLLKCDASDEVFRRRCTGVAWERATAQSFALWSAFFIGETALLIDRVPTLLEEARSRGDQLAEASLTTLSGTLAWLANDQPEVAEKALQQTFAWWSGHHFRTQHFTCLTSDVQVRMYRGRPLEGWEMLSGQWRQLKGSMLLHIEAIRIFCLHLRARCAIACAEQGESANMFLASAERDAKRLSKERASWARPLARLIRAALAEANADHNRSIAELELALGELDAADMQLFAASARWRLGELLKGRDANEPAQQSELWMTRQRIVNPAQMAALHVPFCRINE